MCLQNKSIHSSFRRQNLLLIFFSRVLSLFLSSCMTLKLKQTNTIKISSRVFGFWFTWFWTLKSFFSLFPCSFFSFSNFFLSLPWPPSLLLRHFCLFPFSFSLLLYLCRLSLSLSSLSSISLPSFSFPLSPPTLSASSVVQQWFAGLRWAFLPNS